MAAMNDEYGCFEDSFLRRFQGQRYPVSWTRWHDLFLLSFLGSFAGVWGWVDRNIWMSYEGDQSALGGIFLPNVILDNYT